MCSGRESAEKMGTRGAIVPFACNVIVVVKGFCDAVVAGEPWETCQGQRRCSALLPTSSVLRKDKFN